MNEIIAKDLYYKDIHNEEAFNNLLSMVNLIKQVCTPVRFVITPNTKEEESKNNIKDILQDILGDTYVPYINKAISLIEKSNNPNLMTGCYYAVEDKIYKIEVPHINNHLGAIVGAHEATHVILHFSDIKDQACYKEVMSILVDKISAYILSQKYPKYNIENTWLKCRLQCLKEYPCHIDSLDTASEKNLIEIRKIFVRQSYIYWLGDIYAANLFEIYKQNKHEIISVIRKYFDEEVTLEYILNHYNISMANERTIDNYKEYVKQYKKSSLWR